MVVTDIEIGIVTESLGDHFLISPNALHRGEGEYAILTLHERGMLSALLTCRPGDGRQWNTSRAGVNSIAPELGRDKISSILKGLREKRYLYTRRVNVGHGRFRWEWMVYMKARSEEFDPFKSVVPTIDGTTVDGKHVDGPDPQKRDVSAGRTIDGCSVTDQPSLKEVPTSRNTRSTTPPTPQALPPSAVVEPDSEGEDPEKSAIEAALSHQPTWRPVAIKAALRQAIAEGLPAEVAYRAIVDLADGKTYGPTTAGPQRIIARGPWWTPGAVFVPAPSRDTSAECELHPGQMSGSCSCCEGERLGANSTRSLTAPRTTPPTAARNLFAAIPALQRQGRRRGQTSASSTQQQPTPSQA